MKYEWGNKNKSLTLTVGGNCGEKINEDFDKFTLHLITKMVCDIHYLKTNMAKKVHEAQKETATVLSNLERYKRKSFLWRIWNFITR